MENKKKKLKVFHGLVNYGTQASVFSEGLKRRNITAFSVSVDDNYKRKIDCHLTTTQKGFKGVLNKIKNRILCLYWLFKYNTFHFYYGTTLLPGQKDLFLYKLLGKKLIFEYLGNDCQGYKVSVEKYKWTNVNYFIKEEDSVEYDQRISARLLNESKYADKRFVCAPCYSEFVEDAVLLPLAININEYNYSENIIEGDFIKIMHAPTHRGFKGTGFIVDAINQLISEGYNIKLDLVEGVTHDELKQRYTNCNLFIDQIMGGWYGTAAIEAMAQGRPVIVSVREEYLKYTDFKGEFPFVHADPDTIYQAIKTMLDNKDELLRLSKVSREFVENNHNSDVIVDKLIAYYESVWNK